MRRIQTSMATARTPVVSALKIVRTPTMVDEDPDCKKNVPPSPQVGVFVSVDVLEREVDEYGEEKRQNRAGKEPPGSVARPDDAG